MPVVAVVGGQWGDEGKGKVIDLLSGDAEVVIRATGGDNAGHTVINPQGEFALHLVPDRCPRSRKQSAQRLDRARPGA